MSFLVSLRNWAASGVVAGVLLCLAGCSPEASTPPKTSTGGKSSEQAGSTTGPVKKGRAEVPEPAPAKDGEQATDEKKVDAKPADEKPQE
ncbi:MAG: hypothetical protein HY290_22725 [Planctomycetia bacterium]|nr:hypothetical protein [Planctomycetia bacterium]